MASIVVSTDYDGYGNPVSLAEPGRTYVAATTHDTLGRVATRQLG